MKKLLCIIALASALSTTSCKKEYCWTCTSTVTGNDEELCNMTSKDAERKEGQGYTCRKK